MNLIANHMSGHGGLVVLLHWCGVVAKLRMIHDVATLPHCQVQDNSTSSDEDSSTERREVARVLALDQSFSLVITDCDLV